MSWLLLILLVACCIAGLLLIPLGLPGLWLMVLAIAVSAWLTGFKAIGLATIGVVLGLAILGEVIEWWVGFRLTQTYGGSRRSAWGAVLGGLVGAFVGLPIPVIGSVVAGFVGAFAGAMLFEYSKTRGTNVAVRAGWGAVIGRAAAAAVKTAIGVAIAVIGVFAAAT